MNKDKISFYILIAIFITFAFLQRGLHESSSGVIGNLISPILLAAIYSYVLYNRLNSFSTYRVIISNPHIMIFILFILLSSVWSSDPGHSIKMGLQILITSLIAIHIYCKYDFDNFIRIITIALGWLALISFLSAFVIPDKAIYSGVLHEGAWRGIYFHSSGLAKEMAIGSVLFLYSAKRKLIGGKLSVLGFMVCFFLLLKSQNLTALISIFVIGVIYIFFLSLQRFPYIMKIFVFITFLTFMALISVYVMDNYEEITYAIGKDPTMTNRTSVWVYSYASAMEKLWLGYGYNSFWLDKFATTFFLQWEPHHAHNAFLDILLDVGIIGLVLFSIAVYKVFSRTLVLSVKKGNPKSTLILLILLLMLINSLVDPSFYRPNTLLFTIFIAINLYSNETKISLVS